jgi:pimeloyl-ACP methyl ester carboxylesterase
MTANVGEVRIHDQRLEVVRIAASALPSEARSAKEGSAKEGERASAGQPSIVMLHEGLGSVAMWRDFPQKVATTTGLEVVAYSRVGYGKSDPITTQRNVRYMHEEALVTLPALLEALGLERPILLGHSDGGSIALIFAGGARRPLRGVIAMAPHVMVEEISVASIAQAKAAYQSTDLRQRLARYHDDVESAFWGWNDIWLHPEFRHWNIEEYLPRIQCPVLAVQGEGDEYGTMEQIDRIRQQVAGAELVKLADCRHSPHRDQPEAVLAAIGPFVERICPRP